MKSPPRVLEAALRFLLPPACREHVLGDLHERFESTRQYVNEGLRVLPAVVASRIRRTLDFELLVMRAFALFGSFVAAAWLLGQTRFLYRSQGFWILAIPTGLALTGLVFVEAYADPEKQGRLQSMRQALVSILFALAGQSVFAVVESGLAVPWGILLYGSCMSLLLLSAARMLFPPLPNRSKTAPFNEVAANPLHLHPKFSWLLIGSIILLVVLLAAKPA